MTVCPACNATLTRDLHEPFTCSKSGDAEYGDHYLDSGERVPKVVHGTGHVYIQFGDDDASE